MANLSLGTSIFISIILALILYFLGITSTIMVVLIGFVAASLIKPEGRNYKVGGTAGIVIGVLIFLIIFFTPPELPYELAVPLAMGATMTLEGILDLILGFVFSIAMFVLLGSIGGYIAQALFKPKKREPQREKNSGTF